MSDRMSMSRFFFAPAARACIAWYSLSETEAPRVKTGPLPVGPISRVLPVVSGPGREWSLCRHYRHLT